VREGRKSGKSRKKRNEGRKEGNEGMKEWRKVGRKEVKEVQ
jgi:hypothetical protein